MPGKMRFRRASRRLGSEGYSTHLGCLLKYSFLRPNPGETLIYRRSSDGALESIVLFDLKMIFI